MEFYRYNITSTGGYVDEFDDFHAPDIPMAKVVLSTYVLVRETTMGYWIGHGPAKAIKWISKTSKKRFAYPTKEEALRSLIRRSELRLYCLKWDVGLVEDGLKTAKAML